MNAAEVIERGQWDGVAGAVLLVVLRRQGRPEYTPVPAAPSWATARDTEPCAAPYPTQDEWGSW